MVKVLRFISCTSKLCKFFNEQNNMTLSYDCGNNGFQIYTLNDNIKRVCDLD